MLPTSGTALTARFGPRIRDTAVGAWRRHWKQWNGSSTATLQTACREFYSPFIWYRVEDRYQKRLAALLAEETRRSTVLTTVAIDLLCLAEDMWHLQFVANRHY